MTKKIRICLMLVAWLTFLLSHHSLFAITSCMNPVQQPVQKNDSFPRNNESILYFGIKTWTKIDKKVIEKHWAIRGEIAVGPVIGWRFLNRIGIQIGLIYSYNPCFTVCVSFDRKILLDRSLSSFATRVVDDIYGLSMQGEGYIAHGGLVHIAFQAISLPLFFEFYPEKSRRFVCYGGPRFLMIFSKVHKKEFCPIHIDTSSFKKILYQTLEQATKCDHTSQTMADDITRIAKDGFLKMYRSVFNLNAHPHPNKNQLLDRKQLYWDVDWDVGFEFRAKSGFVIGMNWPGFVLGYYYTK